MKDLFAFYKKNPSLAIFGLLFIIVAYGYRLINPAIGVDTETAIAAYDETLNCFIGNGRFFCAFLRKVIMPTAFNYYLAFILAIIFFFLTFSVLIYAFHRFGLSDGSSSVIFVTLFFSFPIFAEVLYFANQIDIIAIGMLLSTCAALLICDWAFYQKRILWFVLGSIMGIFAAGCYQALFYFFIAELLAFFILKVTLSEKEPFSRYWIYALKLMTAIITVAVFYFLMSHLIRQTLYDPEMKYVGVDAAEYISNSILWKHQPIKKCLTNILEYTKKTLRYDNPFGGFYCYLLLAVDILILVWRGIRRRNRKYIYAALLFLAFAVTPFLGAVVKGNALSLREQFILPFVFAFSAAFLCYSLRKKRIVKYCLLLAMLYISWCQLLTTQNLFHHDTLRYEFDNSTVREILRDAEENYGPLQDKVIVYSGSEWWYAPENMLCGDVIGYSILQWDSSSAWGSNYRINYFTKSLGLTQTIPTMEQIERGYQLAENLEPWPARNSMTIEGNIISIKLSE